MSTWGKRHNLPGYDELRTGLTFQDVQRMLWVCSDDPKDWRRKRRGSVLGLWHSIKLGIYDEAVSRGYLQTLRRKCRRKKLHQPRKRGKLAA